MLNSHYLHKCVRNGPSGAGGDPEPRRDSAATLSAILITNAGPELLGATDSTWDSCSGF